MRAILYARYSSDLQRDASIEDQVRSCSALAQREGWDVVDVLADHALSGATTIRPGYQALLAQLRMGAADIVLAESLDRFSRDQEHIAGFFKAASFAGARIVTLAEGEVSELHVGLKGMMGALFLKDLAAKTKRGQEGRIRAGHCIGTPPYGYRVVRRLGADGEPERGLREVDPEKAAIVRRIFNLYASGESAWHIARRLNAEGVPGPGGGIWFDATIRGRQQRGDGILRNQTYAGRIVWNRRANVKDPATGQRVRRYRGTSDILVQDMPNLRIIEPALWERVQARLPGDRAQGSNHPQTHFSAQRRPRYLLSGKVFCGVCERAFKALGKDYIGCRGALNGGCRNRTTVRRRVLDAWVLDAMATQLMQPNLVHEFIAAYNAEWQRLSAEAEVRHAGLHRERSLIERKLANLVETVADGRSSPALLRRIDELEAQLAVLPAEPGRKSSPPPALHPGIAEAYRAKVDSLKASLTRGGNAEELEAARALIDRVIVSPPPENGGPPKLELVGVLKAMIAAGTNTPRPTKAESASSPDVLSSFISSLMEAPGAEPLAFLLSVPPRPKPVVSPRRRAGCRGGGCGLRRRRFRRCGGRPGRFPSRIRGAIARR